MRTVRDTACMLAAVTMAAPAGLLAQDRPMNPTDDPMIEEWTVPYESSRPRDPYYFASDGKVYFVGQQGHYVAALDPESGDFQKWDLEDGAGPHNLIVADDGMIWYAGNRVSHIGMVDPANGEITKYMMPDERARDPHTLVWTQDKNIWFTVQNGNFVGFLDTNSGDVQLVEMPQAPGRGGQMSSSRPYGIKMDSQDQPWIVLFNTNKIATVDPESFELQTFDLPSEATRPRRMEIDSDDNVWYVDYALGKLGVLRRDSGEIEEWDMPGGAESRPYGMAIDSDDRIWFVETGLTPNRFVGFDPDTEDFFSVVEVGNSRGAIRHMHYDEESNTVWFGADWNTVGRAVLPPPKRRVSF